MVYMKYRQVLCFDLDLILNDISLYIAKSNEISQNKKSGPKIFR